MSTTATYKGNVLATVNNNAKKLKTAGKYLEDDIVLTDITSGGSAITITDELDENGGTIRHINAVSLDGDTVTAAHLESGYTAHDAQGNAITGTLSPGGGGTYQEKTNISPTTSSQTITADTGYDALSSVQINAMPSGSVTAPASIAGSSATVSTGTNTLTLTKTVSVTPNVTTAGYISSGTAGNSSVSLTASVNTRSSSDLTASGATVTAPAGYYAEAATKSVSAMTLPTSASSSAASGYTSKATIGRSTSDQYINIPTGYNSAGAYYKISAVANGSATAPASISGSSATVSFGTNTLTLTKTVSVTPSVSAGYISSGTAGDSSVSLTASVTTKAATTYHPSSTDQTIASWTYTTGTQTIKAVAVSGLSADKILSGTTVKIGDSTDDDCVTSVSGSVAFQTIYSGSGNPSSSTGVNGDIYIKTS